MQTKLCFVSWPKVLLNMQKNWAVQNLRLCCILTTVTLSKHVNHVSTWASLL